MISSESNISLTSIHQFMDRFTDNRVQGLEFLNEVCHHSLNANTMVYFHPDNGTLQSEGDRKELKRVNSEELAAFYRKLTDSCNEGFFFLESLPEKIAGYELPVPYPVDAISFAGYPVKLDEKRHALLGLYFSASPRFEEDQLNFLFLIVGFLSHAEQTDALQRKNKENETFISIMAHDLVSPFNGFLGLTQLLAEDDGRLSHEDINELAVTMRRSAVNIYALIENLLEWSRIQRGKLKYDPHPIRIIDVMVKVMESFTEDIRRKNIGITLNIHSDLEVLADFKMAVRILRILLSNAIKFSMAGGSVDVSSHPEPGGYMCLTISDMGTGISPDVFDKLFDICEISKKNGTAGEPGTGLGLIIAKALVTINKGTIRIESEENKGTIVQIRLPAPLKEE